MRGQGGPGSVGPPEAPCWAALPKVAGWQEQFWLLVGWGRVADEAVAVSSVGAHFHNGVEE